MSITRDNTYGDLLLNLSQHEIISGLKNHSFEMRTIKPGDTYKLTITSQRTVDIQFAKRKDSQGNFYFRVIYPSTHKRESIFLSDIVIRENPIDGSPSIERAAPKIVRKKNGKHRLESFIFNEIFDHDQLAEEFNSFDLNHDFFKKIQALATLAKEKLNTPHSLSEKKQIILNALGLIQLKHFPSDIPLSFSIEPCDLAYFYFFQCLNEPLLFNCKSLDDVKQVFRPLLNRQTQTAKEIQTLLKAEPDQDYSDEKKAWLRQLKNDLHYAFLNEQAKTISLSEHASLHARLEGAMDHYQNQLDALKKTNKISSIPSKNNLELKNKIHQNYQTTKRFFGEKHFIANYIAHALDERFSNGDNQPLRKILSLEKHAATEARKHFYFLGNKTSRLEKIIKEKNQEMNPPPIENTPIEVGFDAINSEITFGDASEITFGDTIDRPLKQLLQKTYLIERSLGYKLKRFIHEASYQREQLCMMRIRDFVYTCVQHPDQINLILENQALDIKAIQTAHPSLISIFQTIKRMNAHSEKSTINHNATSPHSHILLR